LIDVNEVRRVADAPTSGWPRARLRPDSPWIALRGVPTLRAVVGANMQVFLVNFA